MLFVCRFAVVEKFVNTNLTRQHEVREGRAQKGKKEREFFLKNFADTVLAHNGLHVRPRARSVREKKKKNSARSRAGAHTQKLCTPFLQLQSTFLGFVSDYSDNK